MDHSEHTLKRKQLLLRPERLELQTLIITGSSGLIFNSFIERVGENFWEMALDREGLPRQDERFVRTLSE